jgi:hypothetical protein
MNDEINNESSIILQFFNEIVEDLFCLCFSKREEKKITKLYKQSTIFQIQEYFGFKIN